MPIRRQARVLKIVFVLLFAIPLLGCFNSDSESPPTFEYRAALKPFSSCDALATYLQDTAEQQNRLSQYYYALPGISNAVQDNVIGIPGGNVALSADAIAPAIETTRTISEFTQTNNQVSGVDEADFIKTDGDYSYIVSGGFLVVVDNWPADQSSILARIAVKGLSSNLFVYQDTVWVVSDLMSTDLSASQMAFAPRVNQLTLISMFDITDRSNPLLLRETTLEGYYVDARRIDNRVYLVTSAYFDLYPLLSDNASPAIDTLLPKLSDRVYNAGISSVSEQLISPCEQIYQPGTANGTGTITLSTFDLLTPRSEIKRQTIISNSGTIYASREHLYLATVEDNFWTWLPVLEGDEVPSPGTTLHKFSLLQEPVYLASGRVDGYLLNQFALDEHNDLLRITTTSFAWWNNQPPQNRLYILEQQGERLVQRSQLDGLGKPGERIYATRFFGDQGFVVTFQQIDPLYTLDLSDPDNPQVAGELEVPGFSTYLHPLEDGLLLAIGRNQSNNATDVSLFDTTDFSQPALLHRISIGKDSYSEAEYNHKAFTWYPREQLLALPVTRWSGDLVRDGYSGYRLFNGLQLYRADRVNGFADVGLVDHSSLYQNSTGQFWYQPENIRRSFFVADDANQSYLYSVSSRGIKINALGDLATDLAVLELPVYDRQNVLFY
ncbi:MAG: beta-propeller domain-containing protein [Gammaproteobacteria bacterium]|nr:beta-propeller domain-containing protein [Gammaproteobacteria bacterium]